LNALKFSLAGVAEERKFFRILRLDSSVGAGVFTQKAFCALFFIDLKIAVPGKGADGTRIDAGLGFASNAEKNLFLLGPIG
jgi:hypothetical protein